MGFDVCMEFLRPLRIEFWKGSDFKNFKPEAPFRYHADALIGLSLFLLHPRWRGPHLPPHDSKFPLNLWKSLEPHFELFNRSRKRARALRGEKKSQQPADVEKLLQSHLQTCQQEWGFNLSDLQDFVTTIDRLEDQAERPLLYNFDLVLSPEACQSLQLLHSLLFNLRTLLAMDHNAYVQDPTHQALKVDSITDYLPRGESNVNDALLFLDFLRLKKELPAKAAGRLDASFQQRMAHATCLIQSLPPTFLSNMKPELLEESLYIVQMDWLLGTEAGLLHRIREEIYGVMEGYHQIFWPEVEARKKSAEKLSIQCELTEKSVIPSSAVA